MPVEFSTSQTKTNLMRAFAGESQARNRYTFAAGEAKKQNLHVVEAAFAFTAGQEKEHAEVFYKQLKALAGENIEIEGAYPVDISDSVATLLRYVQHNEYEEHDDVYKHFAEVAEDEGFLQVAGLFKNIAAIEKIHGDRFKRLAELLEEDKLFVSEISISWACLNCGYVHQGKEAPPICPVCSHDRGYFIRMELMEKI
ncbi:MAG: rubrerythrin family protein [Clostridia bacterium]|nr:rubrerythrin family protein [Clostridia bacterium]